MGMSTPLSSEGIRVRVKRPERRQVQWRPLALDECLAEDHRARLVWAYVESLPAAALYAPIRSVEGDVGRDAVDPKLLLALWMYGTIEGIGSARELARRCERDLPYQWLCGEVGVNYHLLSDFRTAHGEYLDELLADTVATLMHQGLVTLETVAQDGMRVRASAGSGSFRRQPTLERCRQEAQEHVRRLRAEDPGPDVSARQEAARQRAARQRQERVEKALEQLQQVRQLKERNKKGSGEQARASTTDPEARRMKMADGGFRPAYNVQFASDGDVQIIVGVDVTDAGSDAGQMSPMHDRLQQRYGKTPGKYLVDGGFVTHQEITALEVRGTEVYAPIPAEERMRRLGHDPYARQEKDTDESFAFRRRMATDPAKELYKRRSAIAEYPNAECRNRGLRQFRVRGLAKVKAVTLWHALAFNLLRMISLGVLKLSPASG